MNGEIHYHPNFNPNKNATHPTNIVKERCLVYAPPGYDIEKGGECPALYLLHGVGDVEFSWEVYGKASAILDSLLKQNPIRPVFVVMPFGFESNAQKLNRKFPDKDWFDGHLTRVKAEIEAAYQLTVPVTVGTRLPKRAIAGLSMGGKQALEFGLTHLELFSAIGNFSGAIQNRPGSDPLPGLIELCRAKRVELGRLALFYHAWGREDEIGGGILIAANQKLVDALEALQIPRVANQLPGGHNWKVWRPCLEEFLTLLANSW